MLGLGVPPRSAGGQGSGFRGRGGRARNEGREWKIKRLNVKRKKMKGRDTEV